MKKCIRCGTAKQDSEFALRKFKSGNYGLRGACKACLNKHAKDWRESNPEKRAKYHETQKLWNANNRDKLLKLKLKQRVKKSRFWLDNDAHVVVYKRHLKKRLIKKRIKGLHDGHVVEYKKEKTRIKSMRSTDKRIIESIKNLGDYYIKRQMIRGTNLKFKDIPDGLVRAKRAQLEIKRYIEGN